MIPFLVLLFSLLICYNQHAVLRSFLLKWQTSKALMNVPVTFLSQLLLTPPPHSLSLTLLLSEGLQKHFKDIKFLLCIFEIPDSFAEKLSCAAKRNLLEWHFYGCNYFSCCCILYVGFCKLTFEEFFGGGGGESFLIG